MIQQRNTNESLYKQYENFEITIFQEAQINVRNTLNLIASFKVNAPLQNVLTLQGLDTSSGKTYEPFLFTDDRILLNKWFNELALYLRVTNAQRMLLGNLKDKAISLILYYQRKYNLQ